MGCELCVAVNEDYRIITQNESAFAIIAINPIIDYHSLVLPKGHVTEFSDLQPNESTDLHKLVENLTSRMDEVLGSSAAAVINGSRYRTEAHIHYQLLPVYKGIRTIISAFLEGASERPEVPLEELETMAKKLR